MRKAIGSVKAWDKAEIGTFHHKAIQLIRKHPTEASNPKNPVAALSIKQRALEPTSLGNQCVPLSYTAQVSSYCSAESPLPGGYSIKSDCHYIRTFVTSKFVCNDLSCLSLIY